MKLSLKENNVKTVTRLFTLSLSKGNAQQSYLNFDNSKTINPVTINNVNKLSEKHKRKHSFRRLNLGRDDQRDEG